MTLGTKMCPVRSYLRFIPYCLALNNLWFSNICYCTATRGQLCPKRFENRNTFYRSAIKIFSIEETNAIVGLVCYSLADIAKGELS